MILHNLQNTNLMLSPTKTAPGNSINDYKQKEKEKAKRKKIKTFLQAFTRNFC